MRKYVRTVRRTLNQFQNQNGETKMKGWAKKMIWFFGVWTLWLLDDLVTSIIAPDLELHFLVGLVYLGLLIIPLPFLGDDYEELKK